MRQEEFHGERQLALGVWVATRTLNQVDAEYLEGPHHFRDLRMVMTLSVHREDDADNA